jgi:hypothetical protein
MNRKARKLLQRSFDVDLRARERAILERALAESEELRRERDELAALRRETSQLKAASFGPFFAERVMANVQALQREQAERFLAADLVAAFKPVAIVVILALAALAPFSVRTIYESLSQTNESLVTMAQTAYALDMEGMLCQTK